MIDEEFALFYGIMIGDGCISKRDRHWFIVITCDIHTDEEFINSIIPMIEEIRGKAVNARRVRKEGKIEIHFSDKNLFERLESLDFPVGKKGINLIISTEFFDHMRSVIQGYFATDGCLLFTNNNGITYPRLEFSSISKDLLEQVCDYLNIKGINGKIYLSHKQKGDWNPLYRLQINGKKNLVLFQKKIGFVNPKHQQKFNLFFKTV